MRAPWGGFWSLLLALGLALLSLAGAPAGVNAQVHAHPDETGQPMVRSLESIRDLDDRSWQLVAYRQGGPGGELRLRVVGFPGKVRLNHPTALEVEAGRQHWQLTDLTLETPALAKDGREAAAEFDLAPLLADLDRNRPLRLALPGVFTALLVPPYLVEEWRSLPSSGP